MLGNIRKKLNTAIKEGIHIKENISNPFSRVHSPSFDANNDPDLGVPSEINVAAGAELLQKYENAWKSTFEANKANVDVATNITDTIDRLQQRIKARQVNMNDLLACLSGLPAIEANLKASLEKFNEIEALSFAAEEKIAELSNVCQMLDMQENIIQRNLDEKRKEMAETEALQQKQAAEQRERIRQEEDKLRRLQQERQNAFDEAFKSDMQEFKQTGAVTKIELKTSNAVALEDIDLGDDGTADALEDFLKD